MQFPLYGYNERINVKMITFFVSDYGHLAKVLVMYAPCLLFLTRTVFLFSYTMDKTHALPLVCARERTVMRCYK